MVAVEGAAALSGDPPRFSDKDIGRARGRVFGPSSFSGITVILAGLVEFLDLLLSPESKAGFERPNFSFIVAKTPEVWIIDFLNVFETSFEIFLIGVSKDWPGVLGGIFSTTFSFCSTEITTVLQMAKEVKKSITGESDSPLFELKAKSSVNSPFKL